MTDWAENYVRPGECGTCGAHTGNCRCQIIESRRNLAQQTRKPTISVCELAAQVALLRREVDNLAYANDMLMSFLANLIIIILLIFAFRAFIRACIHCEVKKISSPQNIAAT
jgi:hypothetical protein